MKLSIIMNYYNRQAILERCLWSIHHMTNRIDDLEIVIVDDMSPPGTEAEPVVEGFLDKLPISLYRRTKKRGKNCGMPLNIAAKQASGDILLTHDPDFIHLTPVVNQVIARFLDGRSKFAIAGCYSVSEEKQKIVEATDFSDARAVRDLRDKIERRPIGIRVEGEDAWNCHSEYRPYGLGSVKAIFRKDFIQLGGFDEDFYQYFGFEDTDFLRRAQMSGMPIWICDEMLVFHQWHYHPADAEEVKNREDGYREHGKIFEEKAQAGTLYVNQGREWGVLE